ncbi:MAG: hypothetical protein ACJAQ3_004376, partial [Planctomycetota bacterium]
PGGLRLGERGGHAGSLRGETPHVDLDDWLAHSNKTPFTRADRHHSAFLARGELSILRRPKAAGHGLTGLCFAKLDANRSHRRRRWSRAGLLEGREAQGWAEG